jgi:hypothetical protein
MSLARAHPAARAGLKWNELYPVLCLILLATAPAILLGEGNRNLGLIAFMFISPFFLVKTKSLSVEGLLLLGFAFSIVAFPLLAHSGEARWSTVFYSLMFCALFLSYDGMLRSGFLRPATFVNIVKYLIIAYTVVLLIQQFCVLTGLPIFNVSNYEPARPWKLNALSAEPSHSARIVGLLMLAYILGRRLVAPMGEILTVSRKQNAFIWVCFFWTMITMLSATAFVMIAIVLLVYIQRSHFRNYVFGALLAIIALLLLPDWLTGRALALALATLTLDYAEVLRADHSGAMRIAPMLVLLNYVDVFSMNGLFGNGIDSVGHFMSRHIWGVRDDYTGGGLLVLWYEYGLIAFLFFVAFTLKATAALKAPANFVIWFVLIFIAGVNNQMVWLAIILLYSLNFFRQRADRIE